jgi:hypothetical protein
MGRPARRDVAPEQLIERAFALLAEAGAMPVPLLTVASFEARRNKSVYWRCQCQCGNETVVTGGNFKSGNTKSCGCLRAEFVDLFGQRFGRLTVVSLEPRRGGSHRGCYWCCR